MVKKAKAARKNRPKSRSEARSKGSKKRHTGSQSPNLREGFRSEYLAHYVFSSFGTSVPVPPPEDTGLDLHCTLTERKGQRIWPIAYYSVQVKSDYSPWELNSRESVEWFVNYPLPLFFCIVSKKELRFRIFHTCARFHVWVQNSSPSSIILKPFPFGDYANSYWEGNTTYNLGKPIADFTLDQWLDTSFHDTIANVLRKWVEVDAKNLFYLQAGILQCTVPSYETNNPEHGGLGTTSLTRCPSEYLNEILPRFRELLHWFSAQLFQNGDPEGATRAELLQRHLFRATPLEYREGSHELNQALNAGFKDPQDRRYLFSGIDTLSARFDELIAPSLTNVKKVLESRVNQ